MNVLKHILVIVALLAAMMPCCHALGHDAPVRDVEAESCLVASNTCACHSCDEVAHHDHMDMPQELTAPSAAFELPVTTLQLFIVSETRPLKRLAPPPVAGMLAALQTVQLLI